jgi:hypothetical protein
MQARHYVHGFTAAAALALAACGGGALLVLGFIGSAGGDWIQDDPAIAGFQPLRNCGDDGEQQCGINIQPAPGADFLYATTFDLEYNTATLPGCPERGNGRANGRRLVLNGCFSGEYVNVNQAVSDNGAVRMFFEFEPVLAQGVWVELHQERRRFAFDDNSSGCELGTPNVPVAVDIIPANLTDDSKPIVTETTIGSFTIAGDAGGAWSGEFVGVSGMRLTRGAEVLELERRQGSATC